MERLVVRRTYDASRDRIYRAWTDPDDLCRWYTPFPRTPVKVLEFDLRVGGRYRVEFGEPGETPYIETGEYREIAPPSKLVFATRLEHAGEVIADTMCTIELIERGTQTEVVMTETGFPADQREPRRGGWGRTLDNLNIIL